VSAMNLYSDENPPKKKMGKKIYQALKEAGYEVEDLHHNPNCWGHRTAIAAWGQWAGTISRPKLPSMHGDVGFTIRHGIIYVRSLILDQSVIDTLLLPCKRFAKLDKMYKAMTDDQLKKEFEHFKTEGDSWKLILVRINALMLQRGLTNDIYLPENDP